MVKLYNCMMTAIFAATYNTEQYRWLATVNRNKQLALPMHRMEASNVPATCQLHIAI